VVHVKPHGALYNQAARDAKIASAIARQGSAIASDGSEITVKAQTMCIHSDTPNAPEIAAAVARALRGAGVELRSLSA
jgi:5-oxoprolinase (ATP-hydrolysing) subunit A